MHRFRIILTVLLLGCFSREARAQNTNSAAPDAKMLPGSGAAAGLGSLNSPNLFDGSTNIGIPIYQYSHDNLDLGISLGYNTKGVQVDEVAGPAGLHWNLNAGPSVTRIMRDLPDELLKVTDSLLVIYKAVNDTLFNHEMYLKGKLVTYTETAQQKSATNVYRDGECDEFVVSLPTGSFSFYIGKNFQVFSNPHRDIKIQLLADGVLLSDVSQLGSHELGIRITDEQGNRYDFQPTDYDYMDIRGFDDWQAANLEGNGFSYTSCTFPTRWSPQTITAADGQSTAYTYTTPVLHGYYFVNKSYYVEEDSVTKTFAGTSQPDFSVAPYRQLSGIRYPNGVQVDFTYSATKKNEYMEPMLQSIALTSGSNCLHYNCYQDSVINGHWFLTRVTNASCDGTAEEPYYTFAYNAQRLPARLNSAQDYFGYYNGVALGTPIGASTDSITIPAHGSGYGSFRAYSATYAVAGLLSRVKNAYGGEIDYYYSANSATGQLTGLPTDAGFLGGTALDGVKVDSTVELDKYHPGNRKTTTYTYSGGQLFLTGGYFHYPEFIDSTTNKWTKVMYQSNFLTAHHLVNGSNHGYSSVSVKTYADGNLLTRRDYTFTNMKDASSGNQPLYYKVSGSKDFYTYPYTDKQYLQDWRIGLPLTVTDYDQNNRILQKTTNTYSYSAIDTSASAYVPNAKTARVNSGTLVTEQTGYGISSWSYYPHKKVITDNYYPFTGKALLTRTVTQKYVADTRTVNDTAWYSYDPGHNSNPTGTTTRNSDGIKTFTHLVYNYDVDGPVLPAGYSHHPGTTLYNMTDSGLEQVVANERWILSASGADSALSEAYTTVFDYTSGLLRTKSLLNTAIGTEPAYAAYTGLPSGTLGNPYPLILNAYNTTTPVTYFRRTSQVTLFDVEGNPQESQLLPPMNQYKAMIWDTATGQKLAEAANCRYTDIAYTSFEGSLYGSNWSVTPAGTTTVSADAITGHQVQYLWTAASPGAAVTVSGTQNLTAGKEYILSFWFKGNTLPTVKTNTTTLTLPSAQRAKGAWKQYVLRFTAATGKVSIKGNDSTSYIDEVRLCRYGAKMDSWTYEPLFGVRSHTDPTGHFTWYEYDKLGRQIAGHDMDDHITGRTEYHVGQ